MNKLTSFKTQLNSNPQGAARLELIKNIEEFLCSIKASNGRIDELCRFQIETLSLYTIALSYLTILDPNNSLINKKINNLDYYTQRLFNQAYY